MIIENPEVFRSWLAKVLEPLCDADPAALAKYIYALVKKDKPVNDLRESMIDQLDVFLQQETKSFVALLFKTIESKEYLNVKKEPVKDEKNSDEVKPNALPEVVESEKDKDKVEEKDRDKEKEREKEKEKEKEKDKEKEKEKEKDKDKEKEKDKDRDRDRDRDKDKDKDKDKEKEKEKEREKEKDNDDFISSTDEKQNGVQIQSSVVSEGTIKPADPETRLVDGKDGRRKEHDRDVKFRVNRSRIRKENSIPRNQRSRSRSRSWDRLRRSRSRDRDRDRNDRFRDRDKTRLYRNKSPPSRHDRGFDRRRTYSRSPSPGRYRMFASRSKSRSPKLSHRGRFRNRSPPLSRSRSPRSRSRSRSRSYVRDGTPGHLGDVDMRSHAPRSVNENKSDHQRGNNNRCRDYDEQGYCMRGELCPYDHGNDPVVMEDLALTQVLMFGPQGPPNMPLAPPGVPRPLLPDFVPPMSGPLPGMPPPPGVSPMPSAPPPVMMVHGPPPLIMRPPANMEYSPDAPSLNPGMNWGRPAYRGPSRPLHSHQTAGGFNQGHRALISVPVESNSHSFHLKNSKAVSENHGLADSRKNAFDSNRQFTNCCLVLKKVPSGLNNITHLNNHFAKFGKIINIQVNYDNDPESAMITFSSPAEANAAIKSTEAVLNNRFIKVFWHNSNKDGTKQNNNFVKDRTGTTAQTASNTTPTNASSGTTSSDNTTYLSSTAVVEKQAAADFTKKEKSSLQEDKKAKTIAALKKSQEILEKNKLLRQKTEEKRKEALKLTSDLRKRSQILLEKQLKQQKELIKKLELGNLEEKQKKDIKETIKVLQDSIEKIKKELLAASKSPKKLLPTKKTKEEIQKEILDTELDLISKQQEGGDVTALLKKITVLKLEMTKLQPKISGQRYLSRTPHKVPASKNMSINRTLTNKTNRYKAAVDHRPTKLLVSGYENDEKDLVLSHFRQYGEIGDYIADDSTPSIVLNFKTRQEAENAMAKGKSFQDRLLTVTWFTNANVQTRRRNSSAGGPTYHMHAGRQVLLSGSETDLEQENPLENYESEAEHGLECSEDLLLQDDDEDLEDEERSWRR